MSANVRPWLPRHLLGAVRGAGGRRAVLLLAGLLAGGGALVAPTQDAAANGSVTLYVSNTAGAATTGCTTTGTGACTTIQEGVSAAETYSATNVTIVVSAGTYDENDALDVPGTDTLTIEGASGGSTVLNGGGGGTAVGIAGGTATIDNVTITDGSASDGGGVSVSSGATATLAGDTLSGDLASTDGGGAYVLGTATFENDTFAGDLAGSAGGAIYVGSGASVTVVDDTFSGNSAPSGGGIDNSSGSVEVGNSILVSSSCGGTIGDSAHNVESDNSCGFGSSDLVSNSSINLASSLAANGSSGPSTLAIGRNSSAFEEVPPGDCTITTDERGLARPGVSGASCDAGAFEDEVPTPSLSLAGSPVAGDNTYNVTLTVPSGGASPSESVKVGDGSTTCTASLTGSGTTYTGSCTLDAETRGMTVTATYDGDGGDPNYVEATSNSLTVLGSQTITFTSSAPTSATIGGASYAPTATATSGLSVTFSLDSSSTGCVLNSGILSFTAVGTCKVDANQAGNGSYGPAPQAQQSFAVGKEAQVISFTWTAPSSVSVGASPYTPAATATSALTVVFSLDSSSSGCTLSSGSVSFTAVGSCVIDANQPGNGTYAAAPQVQQVIAIGKAAQTISFTSTAPASAVYGGTTYTPTATATSGLTVTFSVDQTSTGCAITSGAVSFTAVGTCRIDANQSGNSTYAAAPEAQQSFTIGQASQTITFTSTAPSGAALGGANYTPTATATSGLTVTFSLDSTSNGCSLTSGAVTFTGAGTCVIDANQAGGTNFGPAAQVQQSISVGKGTQTVSFNSTAPSSPTPGGATYTPVALASSALPVTITLDSTSSGCTLTSGTVTFTGAGTCVIDANQPGNNNYSAATQVQQSITVSKGSQTVTFTSTAPTNPTPGGATYTPTATSSSGLSVAITLDSTSSGCTLTSGTVTFTGAGSCKIDANQAGNSSYTAAPQVQQSIAVGAAAAGKSAQTISFTSHPPLSAHPGSATYTPAATATSNLPVVFSLDASSSGCTLSSGVVSFTAVGTCRVDANQAGNSSFSAAAEAQQVIAVLSSSKAPSTKATGKPATSKASTAKPATTKPKAVQHARVVVSSATVARSGKALQVAVRLSCAVASCSGTIQIDKPIPLKVRTAALSEFASAVKAPAVVLATTTFTVPKGRSATVNLSPTLVGRRLLRRASAKSPIREILVTAVAGGSTARETVTLS